MTEPERQETPPQVAATAGAESQASGEAPEKESPPAPASAALVPAASPPVKSRPQTNNWLSTPFFITAFSWLLVSMICSLNFLFAGILVYEGEYLAALFNAVYGLLVLWVFGATFLGAPMVFMAVKELERRNFFQAERILSRYLDLVRGLHLHQDGSYSVAVANLALIKLSRGDYHQAEVLYEELIARMKKKKRLAKHQLTAIYINNLANVKVAQACTHVDLFDLELQEAERLSHESLAILQGSKAKKGDEAVNAYPLQVLAKIAILRGDLTTAESKIAQVLELNSAGKQSYFILPESRQGLYFESHLWLALLYLKQGKKDEGDALCQRLISEQQERPAPVLQHSMGVLNRLALQYLALGDKERAEQVLSFAYAVARNYPVHPEAHEIAVTFERLLSDTGRQGEIAEMKAWIRPVLELGLDQI